jgi:hypothetical protein
MAPLTASLLADALLLLHVAVVAFVVLGEVLFLVGGWRRWHWVHWRGLRGLHLAAVVFIALQAWLGSLCPLTSWEQALRTLAGEATYQGSFVAYWLAKLLYVDAPWWVFIAAYTGFALLVLATWGLVPPLPRHARRDAARAR